MNAREFGEMIRDKRTQAGMTQRQLAMISNVGERFVVELEQGKGTSQLGKALAVADQVGAFLTTSDFQTQMLRKAQAAGISQKRIAEMHGPSDARLRRKS
ncbi:helix-turn-helix domain-containing protein [Gluconacetobacter aggeris]|uniref:helix-turn-helix domain-containing protein n=1 Tax=Gluconacetobacter aggeris TaxID=1286186 RepID=UPI001603278F|nr:helix-turn-helix domain-containing protein [Gluconacetobacter aggeris]